jgi:hypothetical protein
MCRRLGRCCRTNGAQSAPRGWAPWSSQPSESTTQCRQLRAYRGHKVTPPKGGRVRETALARGVLSRAAAATLGAATSVGLAVWPGTQSWSRCHGGRTRVVGAVFDDGSPSRLESWASNAASVSGQPESSKGVADRRTTNSRRDSPRRSYGKGSIFVLAAPVSRICSARG